MCSVSLREVGDLNEHNLDSDDSFRDFFRFSKVFKLLNKLMDGATVVTRNGSLLLCCPMGSAVVGARGPPPTLKIETWPNGSVCECGWSSAPGVP